MTILHVANGECTAAVLREGTFTDPIVAWPEIIMEGPPPFASLDESHTRSLRIQYISSQYNVEASEVEAKLALLDETVDRGAKASTIYLWFDSDLFCRTNLLYLLWLLRTTTPRLITIPPGGLSRGTPLDPYLLNATQLSAAFVERANRVWIAYTSSSPESLVPFLEDPFWGDSVRLHLQRFPAKRDGLSLIQRRILTNLSSEPIPFPTLFQRFQAADNFEYGLGDLQIWEEIKTLASASRAPIVLEGHLFSSSLSLTAEGRAILDGTSTLQVKAPQWVGGVFVLPSSGTHRWRWCDEKGLVRATASTDSA